MKGDAVIRVPREAWERMRSFALTAGRDIREATATAMDEYIQPYQSQSGVVTKIIRDLKAEGQSKAEIKAFFVMSVNHEYDA